MVNNLTGSGSLQGGSTLTQQLAKNLFLSPERTIERKVQEVLLSFWLEQKFTKDQILAMYLNRVYFGSNAYGVEAAARRYFNKSARDVNLGEAALLAGLLKAPSRLSPARDPEAAEARAQVVLGAMREEGYITDDEIKTAMSQSPTRAKRYWSGAGQYVADMVKDEVTGLIGTVTEDLVVETTIDMTLEKKAEAALTETLAADGAKLNASQAALVSIDGTGAIRALVGGRDYGESQFNRATRALRQPGSSFKIYTYALAMENGYTPSTMVTDGPISWGNWSPHNYGNSYAGRITIETALAKSINTIPVRLAKEKLGIDAIMQTAKAMGVETPLRKDVTIPLGTTEVTVMDQATAYAVLPAGGYQSRRHGIAQIMNYQGEVLYDFDRDEKPADRILTAQAAAYMNQMMTKIPYIGTARRAALDHGIVTAGKTGTTQAYRDAWFVGYTGNYTGAVWFGNDDYTSTNNMTGGSLPAMTFKKLMDYAHQGIDLKPIPGIENPLPGPDAAKTVAEAKPADDPTALPPMVRPRSLSSQSTRLIRDIAAKLRLAAPLGPAQSASILN